MKGLPRLSQEDGEAKNFTSCTHIHRIDRNKSHSKNFGKSNRGRTQELKKFSGYPYIGRIARSSLRYLSFLVGMYSCVWFTDSA